MLNNVGKIRQINDKELMHNPLFHFTGIIVVHLINNKKKKKRNKNILTPYKFHFNYHISPWNYLFALIYFTEISFRLVIKTSPRLLLTHNSLKVNISDELQTARFIMSLLININRRIESWRV